MTKVTDLTSFRAVKDDFYRDIDAVLAKYGMKNAGGGGAVFTPDGCTFKIKVTMNASDPEAASEIEKDKWKVYAYRFGLEGVPFGARFHWAGNPRQTVEIVGLTVTGRTTKRVQLRDVSTNKPYVCTPEQAARFFKAFPVTA